MDEWVARIVIPAICFGALLGSALALVLTSATKALPAMAGVMVILLAAGIRNSWSAVIDLASRGTTA